MGLTYCVEDELHAGQQSHHETLRGSVVELGRLALVPWDAAPNLPPCQCWRTCGRRYEVVVYDTSTSPWRTLRRMADLDVNAKARSGTGPSQE